MGVGCGGREEEDGGGGGGEVKLMGRQGQKVRVGVIWDDLTPPAT